MNSVQRQRTNKQRATNSTAALTFAVSSETDCTSKSKGRDLPGGPGGPGGPLGPGWPSGPSDPGRPGNPEGP